MKSMNKAFVREPEPGAEYCPRCGSLGEPVGKETLESFLPADARGRLSEFACFCPFPRCDVAYFDSFDRIVTVDLLVRPVYPKDASAPLCGCFGLTEEDIEKDIEEGGVERVRAVVAKAKSDEARCAHLAANGRSCIPEVQKYYMKRRGDV